MATAAREVPPMPDPSVPVVMQDGKMNPDWYRWLKAVVGVLVTVRSEIP